MRDDLEKRKKEIRKLEIITKESKHFKKIQKVFDEYISKFGTDTLLREYLDNYEDMRYSR